MSSGLFQAIALATLLCVDIFHALGVVLDIRS